MKKIDFLRLSITEADLKRIFLIVIISYVANHDITKRLYNRVDNRKLFNNYRHDMQQRYT